MNNQKFNIFDTKNIISYNIDFQSSRKSFIKHNICKLKLIIIDNHLNNFMLNIILRCNKKTCATLHNKKSGLTKTCIKYHF